MDCARVDWIGTPELEQPTGGGRRSVDHCASRRKAKALSQFRGFFLRVSNWIVQSFYNYAVKETVALRLLTVFQHVVDPTRVCTVADKNSAITSLDLRPTVADWVFKSNAVEVRGQFNCALNMPST
jgi:hypothetical protein